MSEKKSDRHGAGKTAEELAMERLEALEPQEGAMAIPVELEVVFIRVPEWGPWRRGELPIVYQHEEGYTVCVHRREIPEELAEEYLRKHPGARLA